MFARYAQITRREHGHDMIVPSVDYAMAVVDQLETPKLCR